MSWCAVCNKRFEQATNSLPGNVCPSCWHNRPSSVAWSARQSGLESELNTLRARLATAEAERDEAREDVEVAEKEAGWSAEEHQRAYSAIQASESLPSNHYPSFQERVWWKAAQVAIADARAERERYRAEAARLRGLVDEVRACGTEDDDPRLRYMIVQIDKGLWSDLRAALDTPAREGGET